MRADRAHLAMAFVAQTLADHRGQAAVAIDAEVAPQVHRPQAEVMRIHQGGQCQHVFAVRVAQRHDLRALHRCQRRVAHHLRERAERLQLPSRRQRGYHPEQVHRLSRRHQATERIAHAHVRIGYAQEGRMVGRIACHLAGAQGDAVMDRSEGGPERVVEGRRHRRARGRNQDYPCKGPRCIRRGRSVCCAHDHIARLPFPAPRRDLRVHPAAGRLRDRTAGPHATACRHAQRDRAAHAGQGGGPRPLGRRHRDRVRRAAHRAHQREHLCGAGHHRAGIRLRRQPGGGEPPEDRPWRDRPPRGRPARTEVHGRRGTGSAFARRPPLCRAPAFGAHRARPQRPLRRLDR